MLGDIEFLQEALGGIYHHHERMDGKGYPLGLVGMEIPEFARVIMVADAFDSMTSNRSYRPAMTIEAAIDELVACSGVQFDPAMVRAMIEALRVHGWRVQGADEARLPIAPEYQNRVAAPVPRCPRSPTPASPRPATVRSTAPSRPKREPPGASQAWAPAARLGSRVRGPGGLVVTLARGVSHEDAMVAAAFGALIFVGELARVTLPGERQCAPIALAAALGYALIFSVGMVPSSSSVASVLAVQGCAVAQRRCCTAWPDARATPRCWPASCSRWPSRRQRSTRSSAASASGPPGQVPRPGADHGRVGPGRRRRDLLGAAAHRALRDGTPLRATLRDEARATLGLIAAASATGVLIALAANLWAGGRSR